MTILETIEAWPLSQAISGGELLFPAIEVAHVMAIALVVGSIMLVDLRLLGWRGRDVAVGRLMGEVLPWTWMAFAVAVATGLLMFVSSAVRYGEMGWFQAKLALIALAGLNMIAFHRGSGQLAAQWGAGQPAPAGARLAGGVSLLVWIGVVICGRWIGFI